MTRTARSRKHRGFDLDARLAQVEGAIEREPASWRGRWRTWGAAGASDAGADWASVRVDLGCGKGDFVIASALAHPDTLYVGLDWEAVCLMHGAEKALAAGVPNVVFALDDEPHLDALFAPGEVDGIHLNFPTPFPRKKETAKRLTFAPRFLEYAAVLASGGQVFLRTDSDPFLQYTKTQLELARWTIDWETDDCRAALPDEPASEYERKLSAQGARVLAIKARPGAYPQPQASELAQSAPQSLFDYLPDDLDSMEYVPHGMVGGVTNRRNHNHNVAPKRAAKQHR